MRRIFYGKRLLFIPLAIAAFFGVCYAVMLLWNGLLPDIIHVGTITYWQAMGIFVLCKLLFGFGKGGHRGGGAPWMRHRMEEKFKNMSPEERARFKQKWEERCNWGGPRGGRRFNTEWDKFATEETPKPTE